jgi:hypothetical protein
VIGLIFLFIIGIYLIIVIAAPFIARRIAKAFNAPPAVMKWAGVAGFLAVTLPIFWDWIPTVVAHNYYCKKDAGVFVYKTVEQWKTANPGVAEGLIYDDRKSVSEIGKDGQRYVLNQRIAMASTSSTLDWGIVESKQSLVDRLDDKLLSEHKDYSTGDYANMVNGSGSWKLWMKNQSCDPAGYSYSKSVAEFDRIKNEFKKMGDTK